ncbi:MAG: PKD domain-containing protein, partial [Saprospiraceae bacterium]|nr:PKD domain-containing protein [Saprospiraceae bacterium]
MTGLCGSTQSCQNVTVSCAAPVSAFGSQSNNLTVIFNDQSANNPSSWSWNFGDGATSTSANPQHTYSMPGTYQVCLTASSLCGNTQSCQNITLDCPAPQAAFTFTINGLEVIFNENTENAPSDWVWS